MNTTLVAIITALQAAATVASAAKADWPATLILGNYTVAGVGLALKLIR